MARTETATKIDAFYVEPVETTGTANTANTALVVPEFHIPTPAEINQLTDAEVSEANEITRKVINSMVSQLKSTFDNNLGIAAAVYLGDLNTSSKVRVYTMQRVKALMLESGWYVSFTKRYKNLPEDPIYDCRIEDNTIRSNRVAEQKAEALKLTRLRITLGIAALVVYSIAMVSLFVL